MPSRNPLSARSSAILLLLAAAAGLLATWYFYPSVLPRDVSATSIEAVFGDAVGHPWAPLVVIVVYSLLAFLAAPQFVLIAATAAIFGVWLGACYAWLATMVSAAIGFLIGRVAGYSALQRWGGTSLLSLSERIERRGVIWSGLIRVIPSGPFITVNLVAGATGIRMRDFLLGTALGILPKILLVSSVGSGLIRFLRDRDPNYLALMAAFVGLWLVCLWFARRYTASRTSRGSQVAAEAAK